MPVLALWFALGFLVLAAGIGVVMFRSYARGRRVTFTVAITHGLAAGIGVGLVAFFVVAAARARLDFGPWPPIGLAVLAVGAAGGAYLFSFHVRGRRPPLAFIGVHGGVGLIAVLILVMVLTLRARTGTEVPLDPSPAIDDALESGTD
jgi:hypothetical protein